MKFLNLTVILGAGILSSALFAGCSGSSSSGGNGAGNNGKAQAPSYVDWANVPSEFNPSIDETLVNTANFEKMTVNAFGFDRDVHVIYSSDVGAGQSLIRIFRVYKSSASWGSMDRSPRGKTLEIRNYGQYQCSIRVENRQITSLNGGCYVRLEIVLPLGSELEVYNLDQLITGRFIPISNEDFLKSIDRATWSDDKFAAIENYLASYTGSRKPSLTAEDLGKVVSEFSRSDEKFQALRRLHSIVSNREALGEMIDREFGYFEREEAKRTVGVR